MQKKMLNLDEVLEITTLAKSTIYALMKLGKFPQGRPMRDVPSRRVWIFEEVQNWLDEQVN